MKDGFDISVAEKMPRMQKKRPNRPWNVDPVLLNNQEEKAQTQPAKETPVHKTSINQEVKQLDPSKAVETIIDLNSDLNHMVMEKKEIQQQLKQNSRTLEEVGKENTLMKESIMEFERNVVDNKMLEKEIDFLNEQLDDADHYIQNMEGLLEDRTQNLEKESLRRKELEGKFTKITHEIHEKAKTDVKVSILERDLSISSARVLELESKLEEEYKKREPLEQEIVELKDALDRVYSSLADIRLKAKREVYGY
jgi:predicted  nucleic acid-binding Zn-ribbon protein